MAWVIDTAVLLDVLEDDPQFGALSARAIDARRGEGLVLCPISYVELAPAFEGNVELQEEFLDGVGLDYREAWTAEDTTCAHAAWHAYVQKRRARLAPKKPLADLLIGAFASRFQGLITRNARDFQRMLPDLALKVP